MRSRHLRKSCDTPQSVIKEQRLSGKNLRAPPKEFSSVDIDERQRLPAGQRWRPAGQLTQQFPVHHLQLADVSPGIGPQVRPGRGRRPDPAGQARSAPCRSRSMSSMLSAPATIPATRHGIFRCALTPQSSPGRTRPATRSASPARDTRSGSSNDACVFVRAMQQSHLQGVPSN
jgi:hypothetical protein